MNIKAGLLAAVVLTASMCAAPAWADRGGHDHGWGWGPAGILLGSALLYSALQPRPYYGPPAVVYAPPAPVYVPYYAEPPVYVAPPAPAVALPAPRVAQSAPAEATGGLWYFCKKPRGYYPYVRECPGGWEKVSSVPPGAINP